jgi:intraflagellar transport protein 88
LWKSLNAIEKNYDFLAHVCLFLFRIKIMQNIGVTFIQTGQYSDAINSFEHIMSTAPNLKAGYNLTLCYYAIGDREKMKKAFQKLIAVPLEIDKDDKYISPSLSMKKKVK